MRRLIVSAALLAALAWFGCVFQVAETEYALVTRFGRVAEVIDDAGLHFKLPPPISSVIRIDNRRHILDPMLSPDEAECLTEDNLNVVAHGFMVWSVRDPEQYYKSVSNRRGAEARLADIMRSQLGATVARYPLSALVWAPRSEPDSEDGTPPPAPPESRWENLEAEITANTKAAAEENLGVTIERVLLKRLNFPGATKSATFQRMEADRNRLSDQYRAEGQELAGGIESDADLERARILAEAERQAAEIMGKADAEAMRIYGEAYSRDPEFYEFFEYLNAYRSIIGEDDLMFVPSDHPLLKLLNSAGGERRAAGEESDGD